MIENKHFFMALACFEEGIYDINTCLFQVQFSMLLSILC